MPPPEACPNPSLKAKATYAHAMRSVFAFSLFVLACSPAPRVPEAPQVAPSVQNLPAVAPVPLPTPTAPAAAVAVAAGETWHRCGALECLQFTRSADAIRYVLDTTRPRFLAIGESHASIGTEGIASSAAHLRTEWLKALAGRASDLVIELPLPPQGCDDAKRAVVEKVEKPVTQNQRGDNKNEYLELGHEARRLTLQPWALEPTCADLRAVSDAGPGSIVAMLELIARLTKARLTELDARRPAGTILVAFGGALHNDVAPAPDRASWSFGPALLLASHDRYVEVDAFVPEHIKDTESWRRMPFYAHYDPKAHPAETTLLRLGPSSFVVIFPRTTP